MTLPEIQESPDLFPAPKTFCMDQTGDLRATADYNFRVLYNDIVPMGPRYVSRHLVLLRDREEVASLRVTQCSPVSVGPDSLQHMTMDEQVRFARANPRITEVLRPVPMQRQLLSVDARMLPPSKSSLRPGQRYAIVRVAEAGGKLLDAEVLDTSDAATARLVLHILEGASFRLPAKQARATAYEGTIIWAAP